MKVEKKLIIIGRVEEIGFPELGIETVTARVDTGAKTSALWASNVREEKGELLFTLFDSSSKFYTGTKLSTKQYDRRVVASSTGEVQERYAVRFLISLKDKKIRATFTLADRSTQVYPILIGRNVLRGKFIVDVRLGTPLKDQERKRTQALRASLRKETA